MRLSVKDLRTLVQEVKKKPVARRKPLKRRLLAAAWEHVETTGKDLYDVLKRDVPGDWQLEDVSSPRSPEHKNGDYEIIVMMRMTLNIEAKRRMVAASPDPDALKRGDIAFDAIEDVLTREYGPSTRTRGSHFVDNFLRVSQHPNHHPVESVILVYFRLAGNEETAHRFLAQVDPHGRPSSNLLDTFRKKNKRGDVIDFAWWLETHEAQAPEDLRRVIDDVSGYDQKTLKISSTEDVVAVSKALGGTEQAEFGLALVSAALEFFNDM